MIDMFVVTIFPFAIFVSFFVSREERNRSNRFLKTDKLKTNTKLSHFFRPLPVMFENKLSEIINNDYKFIVLINFKPQWIYDKLDNRRAHAISNNIILSRNHFKSKKKLKHKHKSIKSH